MEVLRQPASVPAEDLVLFLPLSWEVPVERVLLKTLLVHLSSAIV